MTEINSNSNVNKITVETFKYYLDNYFPFYVQKNADDSFSLALKQKDIGNKSFGANSVAIGSHVTAQGDNQFVIGQYNDYKNEQDKDALFLIGGGSDIERKNIFKVSPSVFEAKVNGNIMLSNGNVSLSLQKDEEAATDYIKINGDIDSSYLKNTYYDKEHSDNTYATQVSLEETNINLTILTNRFNTFVGDSWPPSEGQSPYEYNSLGGLSSQVKANKDALDFDNNHAALIDKGAILTKNNIDTYLTNENLTHNNIILTKQNFFNQIEIYDGSWS